MRTGGGACDMADFCKQCSEELFDADTGDLARSDLSETGKFYCICEGCGFTVVDRTGLCIGNCLHHHGNLAVQTPQQFQRGEVPHGV